MDSRLYWIWLARALPLGDTAVNLLVDTFGTAAAVYEADEAALKSAGVSAAARSCLRDHSLAESRTILDRVLLAGDWILTPEDALYPQCMRRLSGCPAVLYCRGTMPDLDIHPAVAVVGTRDASAAGCRDAYLLCAGLAAGGVTVVSGGARGIDAAAHAGALDGGGITIVVMGCPLDVEYPAENTDLRRRVVAGGSLLVSEYPPGLPYRCIYPVRNRLMVGLSQGVCLAETPVRSGARITARLAREQGRDVFALPGALSGHRNDGAHCEIRLGAMLVTGAVDIIEEYEALYPGLLHKSAAAEMQRRLEKQPAVAPKDVKATRASEKSPRSARKRRKKLFSGKAPAPEAPETAAAPVVLPENLSPQARQVHAVLTSQPCPVDLVADRADLPTATVLAALTELEMCGCAANHAGQQYSRL